MGKFNDLLNLRLKQRETDKVTALAEKSKSGDLSGFAGIFRFSKLNEKEEGIIFSILSNYKEEGCNSFEKDLQDLSSITSEVKSINNQALILHGERIKKAQTILKNYKEGAFTAWLIAAYGNRQTPYNFLQYYEFYNSLPSALQSKIDSMPKQAIYTLASRTGEREKKEEIIKNYADEPKRELLSLIRKTFPLNKEDKRQPNTTNQVIANLKKTKELMENNFSPSIHERSIIYDLIANLRALIKPL